jgi:hypothetical protein
VSELRKQLDAARADHRSQRYSGNLADELLAVPRRRIIPWTIIGTAVAGIAAALLIWIGRPVDPNFNRTTGVAPGTVAQAPTSAPGGPTQIESASASSVLSLPSMPQYFEITPPAEDMSIGSMPSFPGLDYVVDTTSSSSSSSSQEPA